MTLTRQLNGRRNAQRRGSKAGPGAPRKPPRECLVKWLSSLALLGLAPGRIGTGPCPMGKHANLGLRPFPTGTSHAPPDLFSFLFSFLFFSFV